MKQIQIALTQESESVTVEVLGKPNRSGSSEVIHSESLPGLNDNSATILSFNEKEGETLVIR